MIYTAIAGAEVAFWAFLAGGLAVRYLLGQRRLGTLLLLGSPAADALLLALVALDINDGAEPSQAHVLAATYLGFSVAFGPAVMRWADERFAARFGGVARPARSDAADSGSISSEWRLFGRAALAWAIACAALLGLGALAGDFERAQPLLGGALVLTLILAVWFIAGPVWAMLAAPGGFEASSFSQERGPRLDPNVSQALPNTSARARISIKQSNLLLSQIRNRRPRSRTVDCPNTCFRCTRAPASGPGVLEGRPCLEEPNI
jgi:hypothetical protein